MRTNATATAASPDTSSQLAPSLRRSTDLRTELEALVFNDILGPAGGDTKEQFANSPNSSKALLDAIMDASEAHQTMSTQALGSAKNREGLKDILLGPGQLYESLRKRSPAVGTSA